MAVYAIELDWYNEDIEDFTRPAEHYFFSSAEKALDFVDDIEKNVEKFNKFNKPHTAYLFKIDEGIEANEWFHDCYIATFNFRCDAQNGKWAYWQVFSPDAKSKDGMCDVDELYLIPPDSWDKLEHDALKNPCKYFGRKDNDDSAWCDGCPAEDGSCFKTKSIDLVRRAKALGTSQAQCAAARNERRHEQNVITDKKKPLECIKCPYCDTGKAIKLWFLIGDNRTTADWVDFVATNPNNEDCLCNVYVCQQCGRIIILDT